MPKPLLSNAPTGPHPSPTGPGLPTRLRAPQPDPESQALLRYLNLALNRSPRGAPSVASMRRRWNLMSTFVARRLPLAEVKNIRIPGPGGPLPVRLYRPAGARDNGAPRPLFLWLHGGGFVLGSIATADSICRAIAQRSGAIVATVDYRLVPEHDLYAGRDDALAALDGLIAQAGALGIDPTRIAVGGDSAGGNIAAALVQDIAARGGVAPRLQVLVYPATNLRDRYASRIENAEGYLLTEEAIAWFDAQASAWPHPLDDPRLSPALGRLTDVSPALVLTTGFDPIRDDGLAYTQLLREAGVPVQLLHYAGQFHGFLNFDAVLRAARDALDRIGDALVQALAADPAKALTPDRTLELSATASGPVPASPLARDALIGGLMLAEWTEQARNSLAAAVMPRAAVAWPWFSQPWLNPATQVRGRLASAFAPLQAQQTYSG